MYTTDVQRGLPQLDASHTGFKLFVSADTKFDPQEDIEWPTTFTKECTGMAMGLAVNPDTSSTITAMLAADSKYIVNHNEQTYHHNENNSKDDSFMK